MNKFYLTIILIFCFVSTVFSQNLKSVTQNDTLKILELISLPVIDGMDNDVCWNHIKWNPIDQTWIPFGASIDSNDFNGKYKIGWSQQTNLLYFVVKITDDVFVDGYKYDRDPKKGDFYYNYDMLEVFIDEDQSGGLHIFDSPKDLQNEWGKNSVNAFAYHVILDSPKDGSAAGNPAACDLEGESWSNYFIANYQNHFPEFILRKNGNEYTYEFSLKVFDENYDRRAPEKSNTKLFKNKKLGISIAYCDNDDPNEKPLERDNFFGSAVVPEKANNDHWMNADYFRRALLTK